MRRVLSPIAVASSLAGLSLAGIMVTLGLGASPALAAGEKVCTVTDDRLVEISGLLATESGYVVINDSSDLASAERVFVLDEKCKVDREVRYGGNGPRDPEDATYSADGKTIWIADIGDNVTSEQRRTSVALWSMPADGSSRPVLHRLTYPGGDPHDAEALLMGDDGTPYIITKTTGAAEIYRPTAALRKNNAEGVPMEKAGEITLPETTTANILGPAGRATVTGAARSPDGKRITLRTYADAFEWDLVDGDVVKTLTTTQPRVTALADPFGEAIAYTPDGTSFVTVSDVGSLDTDAKVQILRYTPTQKVTGAPSVDKAEVGGSWTDGLTLDEVTYVIAAVGILGAALVGAGVFGILRARHRPVEPGDSPGSDDDKREPRDGRAVVAPPWPEETAGAAPRGTTYRRDDSGALPGGPGSRPPGGVPASGPHPGGAYGGKPGGAIYGSAPPARKPPGGVYGGPALENPPSRGGGVYGGRGGAVYGASGHRDGEGPSTGDGYSRDNRQRGDHPRVGYGHQPDGYA
jgi:hypothetical protein